MFSNSTMEDTGDGTSLNDMLFAKDFCFVQTADGRIVDVIYPSDENIQVVNIKKGIASAFQANFKFELVRDEADVSGVHRASYKYVAFIITSSTLFFTPLYVSRMESFNIYSCLTAATIS